MKIHGAKRSLRDNRGNITIISAIYFVALFAMITFVLDGAALISAKKNMQSAIDIAALSGATLLGDDALSDDEIHSRIDTSFAENLSVSDDLLACDPPVSDFDRDAGDVSASVDCWYARMMNQKIEPDGSKTKLSVKLNAKSKTSIIRRKLEVAMVLDLSGSMNAGGKLEALKTAAKRAADMLVNAAESDDNRVSFVGYAKSVNVLEYGPYAWGDVDTLDRNLSRRGRIDCVSERTDNHAWDDSPPGPGTHFPYGGLNCPGNGLLTLSSDLDAFGSAIDSLHASGPTAGHLGVAWAWYVLSPNWTGVWPEASTPRPYEDSQSLKVVILMTDGIFNTAFHASHGTSSEQAIKLCDEMRALGIKIYSVAFQAPTAGQETLKNCAGDASRYFEASTNAELIRVYEDIANSLIVLRIVE